MMDDPYPEGEGGGGDCFVVAFKLVVGNPLEDDDPTLTLCHGTVAGQGKLLGVRHSHAWVEQTYELPEGLPNREYWIASGSNVTCIDKSNGNDVAFPRQLYYKLGEINPDEVVRYTAKEARRAAVRAMNYGPWHESS